MRHKCLCFVVLASLLSCASAQEFDRVKGSLVTLKMADADLAGVLQMIAKQTGNRPLALPQDFVSKPLTVNFDKTPYWQAIDDICKQEGLIYHFTMNKSVDLVPGVATEGITSYAGPVVFKITYVSSSHGYWGDTHNDQVSFSVSYFWEDRLQSAWTQPTVLDRVTDAQGAALQARLMDNSPWLALSRAHLLKGPDGAQAPPVTTGSFMLTMQPYPKGVTKVKEMSGKVTMGFAKGVREISIDDVMARGLKDAKSGDLKVTIGKRDRQDKNISLIATIMDGPKPIERTDFGPDPKYGVWLVDAKGTKYPGSVMGKGVTMAVGDEATVREPAADDRQIVFRDVPEGVGALKVVYIVPEATTEQAYDFKFADVVVP